MSLVVAIIVALVSGISAALVTYRLNIRKEHVFFMRQKAEELYLALERYDKFIGGHFFSYYGVLKNEITYNQMLDMQIERGKEDASLSGDSHDKVSLLTHVYFPDLKALLVRYTAARDGINKILRDHKREYKEGNIDGEPWFAPFQAAMKEFTEASKAFRQAVIVEA